MPRFVFDAVTGSARGNAAGFFGVVGPIIPANGLHEALILDIDNSAVEKAALPQNLSDADAVEHLMRNSSGIIENGRVTTAEPGVYHPRMYRPVFFPSPFVTHQKECLQSVQAANNVFARLREVLRVVEPTCGTAYGHGIREVLLLACMEVESSFRAVLKANGYVVPPRRDGTPGRPNINHYRELAEPMRLRDWSVRLAYHSDLAPITPFAGWTGAQNEELEWYEAHHATKHNREVDFDKGTLSHTITACAAVYVMLCAQFGPLRRRANPGHEIPSYETRVGWSDEDFLIEHKPRLSQLHYWPPHINTDPWTNQPFDGRRPWSPRPYFPRPANP